MEENNNTQVNNDNSYVANRDNHFQELPEIGSVEDTVDSPVETSNNLSNTVPIDPFVSSNIDVEEAVDEPVIQRVIDVEEEKKQKKLKIVLIIVGAIVGITLLILLMILLFSPSKKKSDVQHREIEDSSFSGIINRSIKEGEFDRELESALKSLSMNTNKAYLLSMDLDSDDNLDLVAYVEDENKKYLLQFEVDEEVLLEEAYPLTNKESFGYVYSLSQNISNWCSVNDEQYTIIHHRRMVLKSDDFFKEYYIVTQNYNDQKVLNNAIEYVINEDFDASLLEKIKITKESLLENNQMTTMDMRNKAEEYFKQRKEEEEKNNAEALKAKELEEQKNEVFGLNGVILRYGTYVQESGSYGNLVLNKNGSCMIGSLECKWSLSSYDFSSGSVPAILIQFNDIDLYVSSWSSNNLTDKNNWSVMYQG